jgi:hypothetical protein
LIRTEWASATAADAARATASSAAGKRAVQRTCEDFIIIRISAFKV